MQLIASVLSDEMEILTDVNVKNLATGRTTTTDDAGRFNIEANPEDQIYFSHAGYDYDTFTAREIDKVVTLFPNQLNEVGVINNTKKDNSIAYLIAGVIATLVAIKVFKKPTKTVKV